MPCFQSGCLLILALLFPSLAPADASLSPGFSVAALHNEPTGWVAVVAGMTILAGLLLLLRRNATTTAPVNSFPGEDDDTELADAARRVSRYLTGSSGLTEISERLAEVNRQLFNASEVWVQLLADQDEPQIYQHSLRAWLDQSPAHPLADALDSSSIKNETEASVLIIEGLGRCFLLPVILRDTVLARVVSPITEVASREQHMLSVLYGKMAASAMESAVLMRQNRQLARAAAEANAAKTEFLATMSHEIRTPLNGVLGMAELLAHSDLSTDQRKILTSLTESGQRLTHVIDDVLDLSRAESGKLHLKTEPISLMELMDRVAVSQQSLAQAKGLKLLIEYGENAIDWVLGDQQALESVLLNLVNNAVKFTEAGWVKIRLDSTPDGVTCFEISDTGVGIPKASRATVFDSFHRSIGQSSVAGTGLGLAICQRLAQAMDGAVTLQSQAGVGSSFRVSLPLAVCDNHLAVQSGLVNQREVLLATDEAETRAIGSILTYLGVRWSRWLDSIPSESPNAIAGRDHKRPIVILEETAKPEEKRAASQHGELMLLNPMDLQQHRHPVGAINLQSPVTRTALCQSLLALCISTSVSNA